MKYNLLKFLFALSTAFLFFGCEKTDRPGTDSTTGSGKYTISGYLYQNCNKVPIANKNLVLWQGGYSGGEVGTTTTDANGYFSVKYKPKGVENVGIGVKQAVGYGEYAAVTPYKNYENATFYAAPTTYLKISMRVYNSSYTNQDTFYIVDYRKTVPPYTLAIPGPFTSNLLYTVPNFSIPYSNASSITQSFGYRINNNNYVYTLVTLKACDTANYVAEVR